MHVSPAKHSYGSVTDRRTDRRPTKWSLCVAMLRFAGDTTTNIDVCETLMPPFPNMTFDLDLWPTDLKINRDHLLIKDYLPTKFEASGAKPSWVISCTRLRATDIPTDIPTYIPTDRCKAICPSFFKGGHKKIGMFEYLKCDIKQGIGRWLAEPVVIIIALCTF